MTFLFMCIFDIGLHKISLGALILSLGLLVDDAIIAVEMMAVKMEQGWDRLRAASFAYTTTALPMLSGTLVTAAGFLPIATAASSTGEYTRSIFQVTAIALPSRGSRRWCSCRTSATSCCRTCPRSGSRRGGGCRRIGRLDGARVRSPRSTSTLSTRRVLPALPA